MKLLKNLFHQLIPKKELDNVELAYQLLNLDVPKDTEYQKAVNQILEQLPKDENGNWNRKDWLLKIIDLAGTPSTNKQRYILSTSYYYLGAEYRQEAIKYLTLYINNGLWDELFYYAPIHSLYNYKEETLVNTMIWLAECYEKEYEFDKALNVYEKAIDIIPKYPLAYNGKVSVLSKQNKLSECLNWLNSIKNGNLYKTYYFVDETRTKIENNDFKYTIDKLINQITTKIKNGYVYKPRNKK